MSIMFISESSRQCQCHPTVSSNLCNGRGRNCKACLSSISHTSWKSRLGCHSYLIHTWPEAVWVDLVQDISEVEQQTIKLCLLTKQPKRSGTYIVYVESVNKGVLNWMWIYKTHFKWRVHGTSIFSKFPTLSVALSPKPTGSYWRHN